MLSKQSRAQTYTKRNNSYQYYDELCRRLRLELESYPRDKHFKRIQKSLLEKNAIIEQIQKRQMVYMFKKFLKNGTTKKLSGQTSPFKEFDDAIYEIFREMRSVGKALKQELRSIAHQIIKPKVAGFHCSSSYLTRLIERLQGRKTHELCCQPLDSFKMPIDIEGFLTENQTRDPMIPAQPGANPESEYNENRCFLNYEMVFSGNGTEYSEQIAEEEKKEFHYETNPNSPQHNKSEYELPPEEESIFNPREYQEDFPLRQRDIDDISMFLQNPEDYQVLQAKMFFDEKELF